jgi:hypothetical protein
MNFVVTDHSRRRSLFFSLAALNADLYCFF